MSKTSDYIRELYNSFVEENSIILISDESFNDALDKVKNIQVKDANSLFVMIASLNLLNAKTKTDEFKEAAYQDFIKTKVSEVADTVISNQEKFKDVSIYYDKNKKCIFFSIFEVVFSFHYVVETSFVEKASKFEPIKWPGVRLQSIAQQLFEYAIRNVNGIDHCPRCGNFISANAKYCSNCGYNFNFDSEIASGIEIGDTIQVEVNGIQKTGVVREKGRDTLTLSLNNNTVYKVKYNALSSITVASKMVDDESQFIENINKLIEVIMKVEDVSMEDFIATNSTVRECNWEKFTAETDGGRTVVCYYPLRSKSKKIEPGDRIFFYVESRTKSVYSIVGMRYKELCDLFVFALKERNKNKKVLNQWIDACLAYFQFVFHNDESKVFLKKIKNIIKKQEDKNSKYEESIIASDIKYFVISDNRKQFKLGLSKAEEALEKPKSKLKCVEMAKTNIILSQNLPLLPEEECRQIEKELDSLIREGRREECLIKSYTIVTTKRPTPKYLRSYLDRIVNTEIALAHIEKAKEILSVLIAFSDTQEDTKPNNLSHLYLTLARLLNRLGDKKEAHLALDWAEFIFPKNKMWISDLRQSIESTQIEVDEDSSDESKQAKLVMERDIVVSKMLIQDVEQYAKTQASSDNEDNEEEASPIDLFNMADEAGYDMTKSFAFRAQMFLDAAAAYFNAGLSSKTEFKMAVAHYARMKGNSLMAKIDESVRQYLDSQSHLIAECDSARSYFLEALSLYNDLAQKGYLQEVLLKYLKIESLASQIEGGRTPDVDWNKGTLKDKIRECLNDENVESQKVLYRTCIAIGSTSETTWHTLSDDKDGIGPLFARFTEAEFRGKAYQLINDIEGSTVDTGLAPGVFFRKVFENRQTRIRDFKSRIDECLSWEFDPFKISSFEEKWKLIDEYKDLMTATDIRAFDSINEVIIILKPYRWRRQSERDRNIIKCQGILDDSQKLIKETTTYYGRILFSHLQTKWLEEIRKRFEKIEAGTLPQLQIMPEPCYLRIIEGDQGMIDFAVTNNGDSTAQSFVVHAVINGKEYVVSHEEELPAGDSCSESFVSKDFVGLESVDVAFKLVARYQGKELPPIEIEATYEVENGDFLTNDEQIPWKLNNTPKENIFKGREDKLAELITHYLSKDRYMTYILYGLTRTGKSSVLDYFCERIKGRHINEDSSKTILTFKWDLSGNEFKNITRPVLWSNLLETNIYDKLSDELANKVDMEYSEKGFPPDKLSQSDLETIIIALNKCNIIPLIAIDEFSYVRKMIENGLLDITFIKKLRDIAYSGNASFLYAGTYDIKDIPKEYGLTGEMNNTKAMRINEIDEKYADELMDVCPNIIFDEKAKKYIRMLSGCVPYWIQWICLNCGKYAITYRRRHLGYRDVNNVVEVMTGEIQANPKDTWGEIDELNFHNNQIDPNNKAEHQLISSISYIVRESTHIERGVSMDELNQLWDKYKVDESTKKNMVRALVGLEERRIIKQFTDETREVYRINVDLFRRWWFAHHRDLKLEFSL